MSTLKIEFKKSKWYFRLINVVPLYQIKREQLKIKRVLGDVCMSTDNRRPEIGTWMVKRENPETFWRMILKILDIGVEHKRRERRFFRFKLRKQTHINRKTSLKNFFILFTYLFLFFRMEETVRNLLQTQGPPEQKKDETVNIMAYQVYHVSYSWLLLVSLFFSYFSSSVFPDSNINKQVSAKPHC